MNLTAFDYDDDLLDAPVDESLLIASLLTLTSRHLVPDLLRDIQPDSFYDTHYGQIWAAAQKIHREGRSISKRTLLSENDTPAISARLRQLAGEPVQDRAVRNAMQAVLDTAARRGLLVALKRSAEQATKAHSFSEALHFAAEQVAALAAGDAPDEVRSFAAAVDTWQDWIAAPHAATKVVPTPWGDVNDVLAGGLHMGRTYVVGGRPGEGKSIALLNFASHAAERGHPGVIFSVEMGESEVVSRLLASGARADYGQIMRRSLDGMNRDRIDEYVSDRREMPLTLVDKADITVDYIAAICRTLKRRPEGLDVIVVDYLQLLKESDSRQARERQVAQISRALKVLARELDCAVIVACQLNRNAATADRKPALSELRESGAIEQDADVVILLHHELQNGEPTGMVDLVVAKNRTGRLGSISLPWRAHQARLG